MATIGVGESTHGVRGSAIGLLEQGRLVLADAVASGDLGDRFRLAHLAALRVAAAVVAERGRPASARRRLMSVWLLLDRVAPEYTEWSAYFAAGAQTRSAIEAGARSAVTRRAADDEVRAAEQFLLLVEQSLGMLAA